jgi:hypothetical protein
MTPSQRSVAVVSVVACAVGGSLALVSAGRVWATATVAPVAGSPQHLHVTGAQVESGLSACAVACLALAVALLAGHGWLRRLIGLTAVMAAAATVAAAVAARAASSSALASRAFGVQSPHLRADVNLWWLVAVLGGVIALAGAMVAVVAGGRWQSLGRKYDAPDARRPSTDPEDEAWIALDQGEDPTAVEHADS